MQITDSGVAFEFDCAFGSIDAPLRSDADGNFHAIGSVSLEAGGPVTAGQSPPPPRKARFDGWTDGREMRLTVTVLDDRAWELGRFTLGLGRRASLEKCL